VAGGQAWWGVKEGAIDMVSIADDVPADAKAKVDEIKAGLKDGSFVIWKGPIVGQDGKEVLAKDAVADDKFLGGVNFYVKGVEGKVPGFYDMAWAYFEKAAADNVVRAELFFDPQTHTARGVPMEVVINGLHRACRRAAGSKLGVSADLILCFLRHLSEERRLRHAGAGAALS
jgi:hypothetical protein